MARFVLNAPRSSVIGALTNCCRLADTRAMMNTRILTICAAAAIASAAGVTTLAQAQQGYPVPPGAACDVAG
jgi:uncharacterized membrane protein